jgi:hypothetical protein
VAAGGIVVETADAAAEADTAAVVVGDARYFISPQKGRERSRPFVFTALM